MRDTKDMILRSLNGLNNTQMNLVLQYIERLDQETKQRGTDTFKAKALQEIREALKGQQAIK